MKNKKLHLINELLNEFDTARSTNDIDKLVNDCNALQERISHINSLYLKDDIFKSILDFISLEVNFTIESELEKLNADKVAQNG